MEVSGLAAQHKSGMRRRKPTDSESKEAESSLPSEEESAETEASPSKVLQQPVDDSSSHGDEEGEDDESSAAFREGSNEEEKVLAYTRSGSQGSKKKRGEYRGRPCHDLVHTESRTSLLSHRTHETNLRGLFNLLCIILFAQNARLVIENLMKYGVMVKPIPPTSWSDFINNSPIWLTFCVMHVLFMWSFLLEKRVIPKLLGGEYPVNYGSRLLTASSAALMMLVPYGTVVIFKPDPMVASGLLLLSITWCLKMISFHHVMLDVRYMKCGRGKVDVVCGSKEEAISVEKYPGGLKWSHFYRFLWMPTMCFQFSYPTTPRVRWVIVLRHLLEMSVCLVVMKVLIEQYTVPIVQNAFLPLAQLQKTSMLRLAAHFSERLLKLSLPNLYVWLLMFLALFHHWLNVLAELTRFGDKRFYDEWWNSNGFQEYWRLWNMPIHNFCTRHIYKPLLRRGISKLVSSQVIFLLSALAHEYCVDVPLHVGWIGLVFFGFMLQIPLMYLTSLKFFQRHPTLGNLIFWISFCFTGQPLAVLVYYYLWAVKNGSLQAVNVYDIQSMKVV